MIAQLNDIAQIWWQWMGSMFWQVSLLIVLVTALDMAIRRWAWPQVRYAIWALVFIKLIIPPTWQMPTSIVSWIQPRVEEQISIQIQTSEDSIRNSQALLLQNTENASMAIEKATWQTFAFSGWISGVVIFPFMLLRKIRRFRKWHQIQNSRSAPRWLNDLIIKTARHLKLKRVPSVIFSKDAKTPAVYGLFRPVLLLPHGYLDQLSQEQAEHVLMHELCHLKRGDLLIHWLCIVLQIIYWFNPLIIWTRRQMRHVCEICCDLSVANILREKTAKYRDTLLRSARELFEDDMEPSLGFLGIFEEPFRLVPRLKWLEKRSWENRKRRIAVTICTSLVMITCVMPMAGLSQPEAQNNTLIVQSDDNPAESSENQTLDADNGSRKVFYELLIMEVDVKKELDASAEWFKAVHGKQTDDRDSPTMNNGVLFGIFGEDIKINGKSFVDLAELIKEMETEPDVKILSTPVVLVRDGESTSMSSGKYEEQLSLKMTSRIIEDNSIQQDITVIIKGVDKESGRVWKQEGSTNVVIKDESLFVISMPGKDKTLVSGRPKNLYIFLKPSILTSENLQTNSMTTEKDQVRRFPEPDSKGPDGELSMSAVMDQASRHLTLRQANDYIADFKSRIDEINKQIKQYQAKVEGTPKREQELLNLNRDYESLKAIYHSLLNRKLEAELAISMEAKQAEGKSVETDKKLGTLTFLNDELNSAEKRLKEKEGEIRDYREKHMGGLPEQLQTNLAILEKLQKEAETLINGLNDLEMGRGPY